MSIYGLWHCTNCDNVERGEREVICWKCGKGKMVFREYDLEHLAHPDKRGREVQPPIVPTTCRCSIYNDNFGLDANGNKWCTLCGNYKGHIND